MEISGTVRDFIAKNFYAAAVGGLSNDASLLDLGIVDSTGVLELVEFLESTYKINVDDTEMIPDNLDSIGKITAFVQRKTRQT